VETSTVSERNKRVYRRYGAAKKAGMIAGGVLAASLAALGAKRFV
jgi:hypothetical protein